MTSPSQTSRVAVGQLGARRHYAVPRALAAHHLLSTFYTDLYLRSPWAQIMKQVGRVPGLGECRRWGSRHHEDLDPRRVKDFPSFALEYKRRGRRSRGPLEESRTWLWGGQNFCRHMLQAGIEQSDAVFLFSTAAQEVLEATAANGTHGFLDHATAPRAAEVALVAEEAERFPGWSDTCLQGDIIQELDERQRTERRLANRILCGSSFARDLYAHEPDSVGKTDVLPLGYDRPRSVHPPSPRNNNQLHVLFVGGEGLRKGIGYLAEAARLLHTPHVSFRAVGNLGLTHVAHQELQPSIELLGASPRQDMPGHFAWADVLVLPSVSDTFGLVLLEAMAHGVPVITTVNTAGPDIVREGKDGFVIPIRKADVIAERLDRLAASPELRLSMSQQAFKHAQDFSMEHYALNVVNIVTGAWRPADA